MRNLKTLEAFTILREMTLNRSMTETVKRAVRVRLEAILTHEEENFKHWIDHVAHRLNKTRERQVRQLFEKRIKAYKIVIWDLTPHHERGPEPIF